ncbi:MAG: triose-phosphate isomerase [Acidobacteria bacterium]|nr:triose-phosphate isomerase [Acidobacteriota bacterium]
MAARRLVVANWKMSLTPSASLALAEHLLDARLPPGVDVGLAPSFGALERVGRRLRGSRIALAAQDVSPEAQGAFTGEVSAASLRELGVSIGIVGHSERRQRHGEAGPLLARKIERLVENGIAPLFCVGESRAERDAGRTQAVLTSQLTALDGFAAPPPLFALAYEPVWAIGTGLAATPAMAAEAHAVLREALSARWGAAAAGATRILYGGSVTPANAPELFRQAGVDGGLVGGASLDAAAFGALLRAAA